MADRRPWSVPHGVVGGVAQIAVDATVAAVLARSAQS
jgi:hypothetical protein